MCVWVGALTSSESSIFHKTLIPNLDLMVNEDKTFSMETPDTMDGRDTLKQRKCPLSDQRMTVGLNSHVHTS